jgi:hypothetical protein
LVLPGRQRILSASFFKRSGRRELRPLKFDYLARRKLRPSTNKPISKEERVVAPAPQTMGVGAVKFEGEGPKGARDFGDLRACQQAQLVMRLPYE